MIVEVSPCEVVGEGPWPLLRPPPSWAIEEVSLMPDFPPCELVGEGPWRLLIPPLMLLLGKILTIAKTYPASLPKSVLNKRQACQGGNSAIINNSLASWHGNMFGIAETSLRASSWRTWAIARPPIHFGWRWIPAIVKTCPHVFSMVEKRKIGAPLSSQVPSLFWALAWTHWSSSNPSLATSK